MEAGLAKGRGLPDWFLEMPDLLPGEEWYVSAFWDLASERIGSGSQTLGRIPWSKAMQFGIYWGLREPMLSGFWMIIQQMDVGYLEYMKGEHDRYVRLNKPKTKKKEQPQTMRG